jgi:hypothetical protein
MRTLDVLAIIDPRLHRIATQWNPLLFATIIGAHLYGFPLPDSDLDFQRRACVAAGRGRRAEGAGQNVDTLLNATRTKR